MADTEHITAHGEAWKTWRDAVQHIVAEGTDAAYAAEQAAWEAYQVLSTGLPRRTEPADDHDRAVARLKEAYERAAATYEKTRAHADYLVVSASFSQWQKLRRGE